MQYAPLLTKSKYLNGLQCHKYLWMLLNEADKIPETDEGTQFVFEQGNLVGELAKKFFPNGKGFEAMGFKENIEESQKALSLRVPLFEAGFLAGRVYAKVDILEPTEDNQWNIVEVKSSTSVKDVHIQDVAFQKYCYERAGLKIKNCFVMYINNEYIKNGEIDPTQFFIRKDVSAEIEKETIGMEERINLMLKNMSKREVPDIKIGKHCNTPYECPLKEYCWDFLPENNVFQLYRGREKAFELFESGILSMKDIPEDCELDEKQKKQIYCEKSGNPFLDKRGIKEFLNTLHYPLYFLDFETYTTAIPLYDGTRPHQHIPFQFSLHIIEKKSKVPNHFSYLTDGAIDTRAVIIQKLKELLKDSGSILVYNQSFEQKIFTDLGEYFPEYKQWVNETIKRMVDLINPFRNFYYYNSKQKGSASIKSVLPALTNKSYSEMEISNGGTAFLKYFYITYGSLVGRKTTPEEIQQVRNALEKYCALDTEAMILIVQKLETLVEDNNNFSTLKIPF
ncbi:MAG: DUF2779 domain-containing protein [bacterium]